MNIDPRSMIAGQPALKIRSLFRKADSSSWDAEFVAEKLCITLEAARSVIQELHQLGYIEPDPRFCDGPWWKTTLQGNVLALASALRPLRRSSADRALAEYLDRVHQLNADPYYLYKVRKALLFGSMLSEAVQVGDVDLAVELVHRIDDPAERARAEDERIGAAIQGGCHFTNAFDQIS
jgi:hypothetical protein